MTKKIRIIILDPKMAKRSGSRILGVGVVPALDETVLVSFLEVLRNRSKMMRRGGELSTFSTPQYQQQYN